MGALIVLLGSWGVLIPFFGQQLGMSYGVAGQWEWTAARGWLQVLPGFVTIVGGMVLILSRSRLTAVFGGWLSVIAGAWFIVGRAVVEPLGISYAGAPSTTGAAETMWIEIANFAGLGAAIIAVAALILGRLSVRSPRDIRYAESTFTHEPASDGAKAHLRDDTEHPQGSASPNRGRRHWTDLFGRRNTTPAH
ncbi:hypothetical protein [Mycolicibacterium gadium]|uniref:Uncharacterized protein n=1 Tax=Mycolicibacterium gadium TaxID=1794 RepID=A0ABT6GYE1_MYCGU|nr:hypothetical protein [Mycolicibacterium gadium]MDG5486080.1 hypothetical protein [Mycolicibacterium gadium]